MIFKNVNLTREEASKWITYFKKTYPYCENVIGLRMIWPCLTVNQDKSIFIKTKFIHHDAPYDIELFYFWHGYLFLLKMKQVWGEEDLEAWEFNLLIPYPDARAQAGIHLPKKLIKDEVQIFQDLKAAMVVYGQYGGNMVNPPIPSIKIHVGGKVY